MHWFVLLLASWAVTVLAGCGGGSKGDFTLEVAPATITVVPGGAAQTLTVGATPVNGFKGSVAVTVGTLPAGVTATPATLTLTPGSFGQISITASSAATASTASVSITGTSGTLTHSGTSALTVSAAPPAPDFSLEVAPMAVTLIPGGAAQTLTIGATPANGFSGDVAVSVGTLPAGVTATPATLTLTPGTYGQISISASAAAAAATANIAITATSGALTHNASPAVTVSAPLPAPDFSLMVAPASITLVPGGTSQVLVVEAAPTNGFSDNVTVSIGSLPAGVTASPASFTAAPGALTQVSLTASSAATAGTANIAIAGVAGSLTHNATSALTVAAPPLTTTAALSGSSFDFGNNLVNNTLTKTVVTVTNTGSNTLTMNPALAGDASFSIVAAQSCGAQLAAGASCNVVVNYDPTTASTPNPQNSVLNLGFSDVPAGTPQTVAITGTSAALAAGVVTTTNNPQVALYRLTLPFPGSVTVHFGTTTAYGTKTWSQSTDTPGGTVSILVAGMMGSTAYHMQASVDFSNGMTATDVDHVFTTKQVPANMNIALTTTTTPGMTPQPGIELLNTVALPGGVVVTDLNGNIIWTYATPPPRTNLIQGVKMLPNGNFLMTIGPGSGFSLNGPAPTGSVIEMREVNLAGDTVRSLSIESLNSMLSTATCAECKVVLQGFHHDVEPLPNGHWLLLASNLVPLSPTSTPPLTNAPPQSVLGDVIIDVDQNMHPVWVWNEFNHLDPNRHPFQFPDWTHSNALVYSPDDGNILISIRHQNWVVKIDYENGSGKGGILWRLGQGGDFTLKDGSDPIDWEYAQHGPSFTSPNSSGVFSLVLFDNGDDRLFPPGPKCGTTGQPPCYYSTVPVFQIDEKAKTADLTFHQILPTNLYSFFGGNAEQLPNGNIEYDICGVGGSIAIGSYVYEVTQEANPQTVWMMHHTGGNLYRAMRIPSLYPGVQW